MSLSDANSWAGILSAILALIGLFLGAKYIINKNKNVGRDDKSIKIGDNNDISNSFNQRD
ncbi:MAG: hypothetical protein M1300_10935 [Epsilonproteobacteria bacterium]|nr:hypothetical protein [Campylobacterota bacterium]